MKKMSRVFLFALFVAMVSACAEEEKLCPGGESACGELCVDTRTDPMNCGGCGNVCAQGELCIEGTCGCPDGEASCEEITPDLFALCFQAGQLVPLSKEHEIRTGASLSGMEGPQTMAVLDEDHLVVVGALDQTLRVVDRKRMEVVGSLTFAAGAGDTSPNHVIVEGRRAYVTQSTTNEITAVDLEDPTAPKVVYSVSTGEGTNPSFVAMDDEDTLWVSLWLAGGVLPIEAGPESGEAKEVVTIMTEELEGLPYPSGVAAVGNRIYVALNNLDESFAPAGNGRLWVYDRNEETQEFVDLGEDCKNASGVATQGERVYITCTGTYSGDGALAVYDPAAADPVKVFPTGGAPTRISTDGKKLYLSDGASTALLRVDESMNAEPIPICAEQDWEFVSDVLVFP